VKLDPHDPAYPRSLCHLDEPPVLRVSGPLEPNRRVIAIVGSRSASKEAGAFARKLAYHLARAGMVVASGGAVGIDAKAHEGAMEAGGTTWCVACTGRGSVFPPANEALFGRIEGDPNSRMIWPFPDGTRKDDDTPRYRNGVLVGLAEAVIVIQAAFKSGSRNAATWAARLRRRLFIVPGMPWDSAFAGSLLECARGAEVVWSIPNLFFKLRLPSPNLQNPHEPTSNTVPKASTKARKKGSLKYAAGPLFALDSTSWSQEENVVFSALSMAPTHRDAVVARSGLSTSSTVTALLTLSLKDVVVEGPDGFFRRRVAM
jgi:DNA processing protein